MHKLNKIKGTQDLLQQDMRNQNYIVETAKYIANRFGFEAIATPIFEATEVFSRPLGETSDVVTKEMYTFETKGGDSITLRPEGTAGVVRSFIENGLTQSGAFKVFYEGAMFRYERPQKGRQRQFQQFGVEALGLEKPENDVEIIAMGQKILNDLNVAQHTKLHINTLGDKQSRQNYREKLLEYLADFKTKLSQDSLKRWEKNPLRILDSKDENDINIVKNAPVLYDCLNQQSKIHFDAVLCGLDTLGIKYIHNHKLVRGFDYYCHTAFEFITDKLGAQGTVLAGGRYDNLCEIMGGKPTAGIGFAGGVERLAMMIEPVPNYYQKIVVIAIADESNNTAIKIANDIREDFNNFFVTETFFGNLKKGLKYADKIDAEKAIIIGEQEIKKSIAIIRNLKNGEQQEIALDQVCNNIINKLDQDYGIE